MCDPVSALIATAAATAASTGATMIQGAKANKRAKKADVQARKDAADTKAANERSINQANQKTPNLAALFGANKMAGGGGVGSTMLTGAQGVNSNSLSLGRSTLLGA